MSAKRCMAFCQFVEKVVDGNNVLEDPYKRVLHEGCLVVRFEAGSVWFKLADQYLDSVCQGNLRGPKPDNLENTWVVGCHNDNNNVKKFYLAERTLPDDLDTTQNLFEFFMDDDKSKPELFKFLKRYYNEKVIEFIRDKYRLYRGL